MIPSGWSYIRLGEIGDIVPGLTYSPNNVRENGLLVYRSSNIQDGRLSYHDTVYVNTEVPEERLSKEGDILICVRNGSRRLIGKSALITKNTPRATHGAFMTVFRTDEYKFVFQLFQTKNFKKQVDSNLGATINSINGSDLKQYKFLFPPKAERDKIAEILSTWDTAISQVEKMIQLKHDQKKWVIDNTFNNLTAKKWLEVDLSSIIDPTDRYSFTGGPFGSDLKASDYTDEGVRIIQLQNIGDGRFYNDYKIFTSEMKADQLFSCNIFPGEIIISKMGDPVARATLIPDNHERYVMASDGIRVKVNEAKFNKYLILEAINSPFFRSKALSVSTGTTRMRIGLTELKKIKFFVPKDLQEQNKYANIFISINKELHILESKLDLLKKQKEGMMHELLNGRKRVRV